MPLRRAHADAAFGILTLRLTAGLLHAARDYIASGQCHLEGFQADAAECSLG
jgi:hypothetical protein